MSRFDSFGGRMRLRVYSMAVLLLLASALCYGENSAPASIPRGVDTAACIKKLTALFGEKVAASDCVDKPEQILAAGFEPCVVTLSALKAGKKKKKIGDTAIPHCRRSDVQRLSRSPDYQYCLKTMYDRSIEVFRACRAQTMLDRRVVDCVAKSIDNDESPYDSLCSCVGAAKGRTKDLTRELVDEPPRAAEPK